MVSCVLKMHRASQLQRLKQLPLARLQMRLALYTLATGLEEGLGTRIQHFPLVVSSTALQATGKLNQRPTAAGPRG